MTFNQTKYRWYGPNFLYAVMAIFVLYPASIAAFTTIVDGEPGVGFDTSLATVNGKPAISYFDDSNGQLRYVRAVDGYGRSWSAPVVVDANPGAGLYTSLAIVNGMPAISYYYDTGTGGQLMYVRAVDREGTTWATPVILDNSVADCGLDTSMVIVNGRPAISYFDNTNGNLRYIRALDANGTSWGSPVVVDATPGAGMYTSMAVVNGHPAISYYYDNSPAGEVRYIRADSNDGSTWGTGPVTLDVFADSYIFILSVDAAFPLAVIDGHPAVSFMDWDHDDATHMLHYIRAADANGTSWNTPVVVDAAPGSGTYSSLKEINGRPVIAYFEANNGFLKYVEAEGNDGSQWRAPRILDNSPGSGDYCSLAAVNRYPAVSYFDWDNGILKYYGFPSPLLRLILPAISYQGLNQQGSNSTNSPD